MWTFQLFISCGSEGQHPDLDCYYYMVPHQVRDYADTSGSGGLFPALLEYGLSETVSETIPWLFGMQLTH